MRAVTRIIDARAPSIRPRENGEDRAEGREAASPRGRICTRGAATTFHRRSESASPLCERRLRSNGARMKRRRSTVEPSSSSSGTGTIEPRTPCHCHCPSNRAAYAEPTTTLVHCDLCERLRGSLPDPRRTEDDGGLATIDRQRDHRWRRTRPGDEDRFSNEPRASDRARDRTTSERESLARCASSVVRWSFAIGSTSWRRKFLPILFLLLAVPYLATAEHSYRRKDGVCQTIDIRNRVEEFSQLRGCRVVEGYVQIVLIDKAETSAYANLTFPELVEITDYLLLYRVNGLKSIGHLFPNLVVIRGHTLVMSYALMAFQMMHLQEVGLRSLAAIQRGSVRFEKNPVLCYVNTIDWDLIAKAGKGENKIMYNGKMNGCPVCDKSCPVRLTKPDETLCWNRQHCQRICDPKCGDGTCDDAGTCCHPSCLGGCTGPTERDCTVCKDMVVAGKECKSRCPDKSYKFMNRRCIQEQECREMHRPRELLNIEENPYKLYNDSCVLECPAGYMNNRHENGNVSCTKCEGLCPKNCSAVLVYDISTAQKLRGCTYISGSLTIQLRGASGKNMARELEESMGTIEVIDGFLKIIKSSSLISLNFLKNLRRINGNDVINNLYSLYVIDNQNLQELWDWSTHPTIKILSKNGSARVYFHYNPKLCLHKIDTLREKANLDEFTEYEVASNSNGDKIACNVTELQTNIIKKSSSAAIIEWKPFVHHDPRSLLSYLIYHIEAPYQNVTIYDGRDACGGNSWKITDISPMMMITNNGTEIRKPDSPHTYIMTDLRPYTQYAYYVKTYTIASERFGAQSKIKYFTTYPDKPSEPRALSIYSNSSSELVISWLPPLHKNGNLTHYRIVGYLEPDDPEFIDQRKYCDETMPLPDKTSMSVMVEEEKKRAESEKKWILDQMETESCSCANREIDQLKLEAEKEAAGSIAFENAVHNVVYVKRINSRRKRGSNETSMTLQQAKDLNEDKKISDDKMENHTDPILVPSTNLTYVMRNLQHFAAYTIEVQACRELTGVNDSRNCSTEASKMYRTLAMENANDIPPNTFGLSISGENNSLTVVTLYWDEPPQPNGLIVTYHIEYKRVDIINIQATVVCITRDDFRIKGKGSYHLKNIPTGNYSVKVRATSLAGNGAYTEVKYFFIPEYAGPFSTVWIVILTIVGGLCSIVIGCLARCYYIKRQSMRNVASMKLIATVNPEYVSSVYVPDEWEVPRKKIQLLRELGNGSFGMVYEGVARDIVEGKPEVRCAVKTINENATDRQRVEFLNEASVMKAFNTHHVIKLLGVVSQSQPTLVVMELMVNGDLKTYLRSHRPDVCENFNKQPPTLKRILQMAIEIADGMAYLSANKFVHRDLAARNCMVAEDLTVKIGDFGMTRDIYETDYYRKGTKGLLPVRWMAPESLKDGVFTSFSDIWSYGVVLWEMVTLASQPYQGLSNDQVLRYVIDGGVMERPENCPDSLYNLMRHTWSHKATRRPTFIDIATMLLQEVDVEAFQKVSFYHTPAGIEARNLNDSPQNKRDLDMVTAQDLGEEEIEGEEDSPLRQDFDEFASFEPTSIKHNISPRYGIDMYGENSKATSNIHDMNCSKIPLKAGFDDFDGVSGDSLASSKDTLNLPFVEDSLKSVKSSPFIHNKNTSRGNVSQISLEKSASPQSLFKQNFLDSPNHPSKSRGSSDYENRSPEIVSSIEKKMTPLDFPSMDALDIYINSDKNDNKNADEYVKKSETLNNGYIGNTTT